MITHGGLTYEISMIGHLLELRVDHALRPVGLTSRQYTALAHIAAEPNLSRAELARALRVSPQAVGGLTRRLAEAGLIERGAPDPGRATEYRLTAGGGERLGRALPLVAEAERRVVSRLPDDKAMCVLDGVRRLLADFTPDEPADVDGAAG